MKIVSAVVLVLVILMLAVSYTRYESDKPSPEQSETPADIQTLQLDNGMLATLITQEDLEDVFITVSVAAGHRQDKHYHQGFAHFYEHIAVDANPRLDHYGQLARRLNRYGADSQARVLPLSTYYRTNVNRDHFDEVIGLYAGVFDPPNPSDVDIQKTARIIENELHGSSQYRSGLSYNPHLCRGDRKQFLTCMRQDMATANQLGEIDPESVKDYLTRFYKENIRHGDVRLVVISPYAVDHIKSHLNKHFVNKVSSRPPETFESDLDFALFSGRRDVDFIEEAESSGQIFFLTPITPENKTCSAIEARILQDILQSGLRDYFNSKTAAHLPVEGMDSGSTVRFRNGDCYLQAQVRLRQPGILNSLAVERDYFRAMEKTLKRPDIASEVSARVQQYAAHYQHLARHDPMVAARELAALGFSEGDSGWLPNFPTIAESATQLIQHLPLAQSFVHHAVRKSDLPDGINGRSADEILAHYEWDVPEENAAARTSTAEHASSAPDPAGETWRWQPFWRSVPGNQPELAYASNRLKIWHWCSGCKNYLLFNRVPSGGVLLINVRMPSVATGFRQDVVLQTLLPEILEDAVLAQGRVNCSNTTCRLTTAHGLDISAHVTRESIEVEIGGIQSDESRRQSLALARRMLNGLLQITKRETYDPAALFDTYLERATTPFVSADGIAPSLVGRAGAAKLVHSEETASNDQAKAIFEDVIAHYVRHLDINMLLLGGFRSEEIQALWNSLAGKLTISQSREEGTDGFPFSGHPESRRIDIYDERYRDLHNLILLRPLTDVADGRTLAKYELIQYLLGEKIKGRLRDELGVTYVADAFPVTHVKPVTQKGGVFYLGYYFDLHHSVTPAEKKQLIDDLFSAANFNELEKFSVYKREFARHYAQRGILSLDVLRLLSNGLNYSLIDDASHEIEDITAAELQAFYERNILGSSERVWVHGTGKAEDHALFWENGLRQQWIDQ